MGRRLMSFVLTPPLVKADGFGYSVIQVGHMELPESLVIRMTSWSAVELIRHWRNEVGQLLAGQRKKGCLVCGLKLRKNGVVVPSGWWNLYRAGGQVLFQYQVLRTSETRKRSEWALPREWWRKVSEYSAWADCADGVHRKVSEWSEPVANLFEWCQQCDILLGTMGELDDIDDQ